MAAVLTASLILLAVPAAAVAHPAEDLEAWVDEWVASVLEEGLAGEDLAAILDMARRHPCWFRGDCYRPARSSAAPAPRVWAAGVEQWRGLVSAYFAADQVDRAMRVMACESGGNPSAKNPGSSASGLFQHLGRYWSSRSASAGWAGASIWDPEANIAVAAWLQRTGGWSHWVCR